jgi:hypothetical protein
MPLRKTLLIFLSFHSKFQVYRLKNKPPDLAQNMPPVMVELKPEATPISQKQYFILPKAQFGIQEYFDRFLKYGIIQLWWSYGNTPLLTVQKRRTKDFRQVQDLQAVNSAIVTLHPIVPNPYMLLGLVPAEAVFYLPRS